MKTVTLRRFRKGDEFAVSDVICTTLAISNRKDYSPAFIEESYLTSIFVLPDYQGEGVGRKIVETLEADEYFRRAWRTEVGSSLTAVSFYRKMGYEYKNETADADKYGVVRLEKRKGSLR